LTPATTIFNSFTAVLALAIGFSMGLGLLVAIKNMFS